MHILAIVFLVLADVCLLGFIIVFLVSGSKYHRQSMAYSMAVSEARQADEYQYSAEQADKLSKIAYEIFIFITACHINNTRVQRVYDHYAGIGKEKEALSSRFNRLALICLILFFLISTALVIQL